MDCGKQASENEKDLGIVPQRPAGLLIHALADTWGLDKVHLQYQETPSNYFPSVLY
jgi:hypothetical protein